MYVTVRHACIIFITGILINIRIESAFVRLLQRSPSQHFSEVKFQLPERNQFAEDIIRIVTYIWKISMRTTRNDYSIPGFWVSITVNIPHVFSLYTRALTKNCCLDILGHNVICHFRHSDPHHSQTSLVTVTYFVCRSPASACLKFGRITDITHRRLIISGMIGSGIHIWLIHDIQVHTVSEHLVIFLQSQQLHFVQRNLVIQINQFVSVISSIFTIVIRFESHVCILPYYVKILIRSFSQQFIPTSLMFLRVKITVYCSRCKMNLHR